MESKDDYVTYSKRVRTGERPQSAPKINHFHGYRTTKQWVEETSQQCRGVKPEKQQHYDDGRPGLSNSLRAASKKKDGRVHFKQENEQTTASSLASKFVFQASPLTTAILRKDCFPDSHIAALSPISLNVGTGGRRVSNFIPLTKQSPVAAVLPGGIQQTQGQIAVVSPDGGLQAASSGRDHEERQVVWCNAAFEADDDLRSYKSQDSAHSGQFSTSSCSKPAANDVTNPTRKLLSSQKEQTVTSEYSNADVNGNAATSLEKSPISPAISTTSAVAGSSPATVIAESPVQDTLPHIAQLELEATAGHWYTPTDLDKGYAKNNEKELSKTRRTLAAMASFKAAQPPSTSNCHRGTGNRVSSSGREETPSTSNDPKYYTEVPSNRESVGRSDLKRAVALRGATPRFLTPDRNSRSAKRSESTCVTADCRASGPARTIPKQIVQPEAMVEADLEADIEHEIEEEIAKEILQLSERLAALHSKQHTRRAGGTLEKSKMGGMSCPQTPLRSVPSSSDSDSVNRRRGRVVAAKFLQYKNDKSNVKHGPEKSEEKNEKFAPKHSGVGDGPFLGRANPPRRSLGTPARLLTREKAGGQPRTRSPNHTANEELKVPRLIDSGAQTRENATTRVTTEEYIRNRSVPESGSRNVAGVTSHRNLGEEERKDWNQWNDSGVGKKKDHQPVQSAATCSAAVQSQFYPEFERKLDWVKTLRTGTVPAVHPSLLVNPASQALDENFLMRKPERQDVRAWLREHVRAAEGDSEIPSFAPFPCAAGFDEDASKAVRVDVQHTIMPEDLSMGVNPARSMRPNNAWTTPVRNAGTTPVRNAGTTPLRNVGTTPNRFTPTPIRSTPTPNRSTPPSSGNARFVASRYGTPTRAASARHLGSRYVDPKLVLESTPKTNRRCSRSSSPRKRVKDVKVGFPMRKVSPTIRKGYPGLSGVKTIAVGVPRESRGGGEAGAFKHQRRVLHNEEEHLCSRRNQNSEMDPAMSINVERKIMVVDAEYEKFVEEGIHIEKQLSDAVCDAAAVLDGVKLRQVQTKAPSLKLHGDAQSIPPAKTIFIRCSDLIKDKHFLMKSKQYRLTGQSVLPPDGQESDDSVFARSNTKTDSEQDGSISRSEASIIEESNSSGTVARDCQLLSHRGDVEGVQFLTGSSMRRSEKLRTPDYDVVYETGKPGVSAYLPEDYTLEMMLEYVDTLKSEREGLPRIKATKDVVVHGNSPRDSGCIKRTRESERSARFPFKASDGADNLELTNLHCIENEGLSPNEIEGLDLESFWCLVGELEGPIMISHP